MSKLWLIEVVREIEEPYTFHIRQEDKPSTEQIVKELSEDHYIDDDPDYTKYKVSEVTV